MISAGERSDLMRELYVNKTFNNTRDANESLIANPIANLSEAQRRYCAQTNNQSDFRFNLEDLEEVHEGRCFPHYDTALV